MFFHLNVRGHCCCFRQEVGADGGSADADVGGRGPGGAGERMPLARTHALSTRRQAYRATMVTNCYELLLPFISHSNLTRVATVKVKCLTSSISQCKISIFVLNVSV